MGVQVRERTVGEIERKLAGINTSLNKIIYLESALTISGLNFEIKRFIWKELAKLYEDRKMFEKAARAMSNRAGMEVLARDRIDSYINAAELFSKVGKVDDADDIFLRALRDADAEQSVKIKLARKNIFSVAARDLEKKGKKASAVRFYEKLLKMNLDNTEKLIIKDRLLEIYMALGMSREARLLNGS